MPYSKENIPSVAKNWSEEEQTKCILAANSTLKDGGSEQDAIFACINAVGKSKKNDEEVNMEEVLRFDEINLDEVKLKETPEGYLEGFAVATRTGVFQYMRADGSIQKELRLPEEVFKDDAINSFKLQPITDDHPNEQVNADNAKALAVGVTGQEIKVVDGKYLAPYVKITDKKAVQSVKAGKRGLSFGYSVSLEKKDGVYNGERYDYIQRNIKGNHLAIVYQGRAGDQARLRLDSQAAICVFNNNFNNNPNENMSLRKIRLDEKDFEVAEEIAAKLDSSAAEISSLKNTEKELKQKVDSLEGERDALKTKLDEELKKDHSVEMSEKVKARIALISKASEFTKEDVSELSDKDIQVKAISSVCPDFKADGKSDEYISARFDTICDFKKDANLAESFKIASNKNDSDNSKVATSNQDLARDLIKRSTKKE